MADESFSKEELEQLCGKVWSLRELTDEFHFLGFQHLHLIVKRIADGFKGTVEFQGSPEFYFNFVPFRRYRN